jgi:glycosyltransferase involved in cell wall biosynthesis
VISIITPAYNEAQNLPVLYERLVASLERQHEPWEWVVVDDHSRDGTSEQLHLITEKDSRVHGIRLSRNSGSHRALLCGLERAQGECAILMAADLKDPPEVVPALIAKWREGAQIVWAVRDAREGESAVSQSFSLAYYWVMRSLCGIRDMPPTGADFFLLDRVVIDALAMFHESNTSVIALITWMGFRQDQVGYTKNARLHGTSGWTLEKKIKLFVDSVTSFTHFPIRVISYLGFGTAAVALGYALVVLVNAIAGHPTQGWSSLMFVVLLLAGVQMSMMGILGEYLWRALDEIRKRPRYLIEWSSERATPIRGNRNEIKVASLSSKKVKSPK